MKTLFVATAITLLIAAVPRTDRDAPLAMESTSRSLPSNPTHPFLLFHGTDVGPGSTLYNRMVPPGSPLHPVYTTLRTTVGATGPVAVPVTDPTYWEQPAIMGYFRDLCDVAFRAAIEEHGTVAPHTYAPQAIAALKHVLFVATPPGGAPWVARQDPVTAASPSGKPHWVRRKTWRSCFFVTAIALAYDWLHEFMTVDERLSVQAFLERCAIAGLQAHFEGNPDRAWHYYQFRGAATNYASSAACQIAIALLAIEPEADGSGGGAAWSYSGLVTTTPSPIFPQPVAVGSGNLGTFPASSTHPPDHHAPFGDIDVQIVNALNNIKLGWLDAISADGSIDEEHVYARQPILGLLPAYAALRNDFGPTLNHLDIITGTHIVETPEWFCRSLIADRHPFTGDNSDTYPSVGPGTLASTATDGNEYDHRLPVPLYLIVRDHTSDPAKRSFFHWGFSRIRSQYDARTGNNPAQSFGYGHESVVPGQVTRESDDTCVYLRAKVLHCLFGPTPTEEATGAPERILSGFFRDDEGVDDTLTLPAQPFQSPQNQFSQVHASRFVSVDTAEGSGGRFYLHNSPDPSWKHMALQYIVKDEWMHHGHEDSGHLDLAYEKFFFLMDSGRADGAAPGNRDCTTGHGIVLRKQPPPSSAPFELGTANAYDCPQFPNLTPSMLGRYRSEVRTQWLAEGIDFVRADHRYVWGGDATAQGTAAPLLRMARAERTILFIKSPVDPTWSCSTT